MRERRGTPLVWASLVTGLLLWSPPTAGAQGVVSVLMLGETGHPVEVSVSGEMSLVTDTLMFRVESGTVRSALGSRVTVESVALALREVDAGGEWRLVHRGYRFPVGISVDAGGVLELPELILGITTPGLLEQGDLRPMIEVVLTGVGEVGAATAALAETLDELFDLGEADAGTRSEEIR